MCHELQSSLEMEFWAWNTWVLKRVSRDPSASDESKIFFKNSDSDSPADGESKSIVRISIAQSSAKLGVIQ